MLDKFTKKMNSILKTQVTLGLVACILTLAWFLLMLILINNQLLSERLDLNEWGDFLAGFCSPVAFLWLALGYFQQGKEIRQNTEMLKLQAQELKSSNEALRLQAVELKNSVEQQQALVNLTREQMEHDKDLAKKNLQPKFDFVHPSLSNHDLLPDPVVLHVEVLNKGAAISLVQFHSQEPWEPSQGNIKLGRDQSLSVKFSAKKI